MAASVPPPGAASAPAPSPSPYPLKVRYGPRPGEQVRGSPDTDTGGDAGDGPLRAEFGESVLAALETRYRATRTTHSFFSRLDRVRAAWDGRDTLTLSVVPPGEGHGSGAAAAQDTPGRAAEGSPGCPAPAPTTPVAPVVALGQFRPCPLERIRDGLQSSDGMAQDQTVRVAAASLVVRGDSVLLTRRAATMRTFPGIWVLPGGHAEVGESLETTALRELWEETGLDCRGSAPPCIALWQSVFPQMEAWGPPRRQHIISYFLVEVDAATPVPPLTIDPDEVDAYAWVDADTVAKIVAINAQGPNATACSSPSGSMAATVRRSDGSLAQEDIDLESMSHLSQQSGRLSTATLYLLSEWLAGLAVDSA